MGLGFREFPGQIFVSLGRIGNAMTSVVECVNILDILRYQVVFNIRP